MTTERCFMNSWTNVSIESVDSFPQPIKGQFWQGEGAEQMEVEESQYGGVIPLPFQLTV